MAHKAMEDCISIAGNKSTWNEKDKEEIINKAARKYRSMNNQQERPGKEKDLRKNATPIAANLQSIRELLSSSSSSSPCESSASSKSKVSSESSYSSSDKL